MKLNSSNLVPEKVSTKEFFLFKWDAVNNERPPPSAGRHIENHGVVHNMWFNTSSTEKKPYYQTQFVNDWWDNGSLPIWITAQRQVCAIHLPSYHCDSVSLMLGSHFS